MLQTISKKVFLAFLIISISFFVPQPASAQECDPPCNFPLTCIDGKCQSPGGNDTTGCQPPCNFPLICIDGKCQSPGGAPGCQPLNAPCDVYPCCEGRNLRCNADKICVRVEAEEDKGPTCNDGSGINTAIGCIPIQDTNEFIGFFLRWALGIGGGIAFLLILYAGFIITTSSGDPKKLQAGKELMTSAVAGLMLLIFAIFILQFIGVQILDIPWFK